MLCVLVVLERGEGGRSMRPRALRALAWFTVHAAVSADNQPWLTGPSATPFVSYSRRSLDCPSVHLQRSRHCLSVVSIAALRAITISDWLSCALRGPCSACASEDDWVDIAI